MTKIKTLDTGLIKFELPFDRGTEAIYFNPNDIDFYIRMVDMIESISTLYDEATEGFAKTNDNSKKLDIMRELDSKIKNAFDVGFGNNVSETIFKYVSPHGIVAGNQYYSFYILEYLLPLIEKVTGNTAKATASALEKTVNKHGAKHLHKLK